MRSVRIRLRGVRASGLALAGCLACATVAPAARAQSTDRVLAEALFREGRDLMAHDKVHEACDKFGESYRLDPALGTLINLALCHEKDGKTASAWAEFNDAASEAAAEKDDREAFARKHLAALAAELPRLTITVAPATSGLPSLELRIDGHPVGRAAWSSPFPIDPGDHEVSAGAAGKKPFALKFSVPRGAGATGVSIPLLEDAPEAKAGPPPAPAVAEPPPSQSASGSGRTQRTIGIIVGGVGVAGLAVGTILGVRAIGLKKDRDALCSSGNICDPSGVAKDQHARDTALGSTIGFVAGGALLAGGVVLFLTAAPSRATRPSVQVGLAGNRVVVGGSF
jgi:hypothetical protein